MRLAFAVAWLAWLAATSMAWAGDIQVSEAWARATVSNQSAAVYLTLKNGGQGPERLIKVETPIARGAELHATEETAGVMRMRHLPELILPAAAAFTLAPRGTHIMLIGLERPLAEGERFGLTLHFAGGRSQSIEVAVTGAGAMGPPRR